MSGFLPIDVIKAVKIRPGIYNKDALIPPRREHKQQLWMEVAEVVTPAVEWECFTEEEKETRISEVYYKWRNLRDHFCRVVKLIEAGDMNNKRKYIYFDDMEFVRPYIGCKLAPVKKRQKKTTDSFNTTQELAGEDTDIDMDAFLKLKDEVDEEEKKVTVIKNAAHRTRSKTVPVLRNRTKRHQNKVSSSTQKVSHSRKEVDIKNFDILKKICGNKNPTFKISESDISFCLSLVPTLRQLVGARKLSAKIDILKVLHTHLEHIERNRHVMKQDMENEEVSEDSENVYNDKRDPLNNNDDCKKWKK